MFNLFYQNKFYFSKIEHKLREILYDAYLTIYSLKKILQVTETKTKEFATLVHKSVPIKILMITLIHSKLNLKKQD